MRRPRTSALLSGVLTGLLASPAFGAATLLDDFESANASDSWSFSNGAEFPGATGSSATGPGRGGQVLSVRYDFSGGGAYVAVTHTLSQAVAPVAVRVKLQAPPDASLGLNVQDSTGQWLQYTVARPLAPLGEGQWVSTVVEVGPTERHFSGADDGMVHPPITALSFTFGVHGSVPTGTVLLDDVELLDSFEFDVDPSTVPLAPAAAGVSSLMDGLGVAIHSTSDAEALDAAQSAGLEWVRTDLFWSEVERTPGVYDFGPWDGLLDLLDARGMKALFILDYGNDLYGGGPPTSPPATAAFAAYARAAAEHYAGRGVRFEVWNEPDNEFWTPTDPVAYAAVAALVIDAVHAGDPTALVSTGGISWFDFEFLETALRAGAASGADAVGVHPYRGTSPPESLPDHVVYARALIRREVGRDLPLWDTEWGYTATQFGAGDSAAAQHRQAVMAVREMMSARVVGFPLAVWYDLRDDGTDPQAGEHNFGLIAYDGSDKPAIVALRALRAAALERTVAGVIDVAQPALSGIRLDGTDDTVLVLWSTSPEVDVRISVPNPVAATDMLGAPLAVATSYTLAEPNGPIYLTFDRAPDAGLPGTGATGSGGAGATGSGGNLAAAGTSGGAGASAGGVSADGGTTEPGVSGSSNDTGGCGCRTKNGAPSSGVMSALLAGLATVRRRRRAC